jgi:nitrite reductase/ring-hydroxylating ferredoxin subunit
MPPNIVELTCHVCEQAWIVNLDRADEAEAILYREENATRAYRAQCPHCGAYNVFEVEETRDE